MIRKISFGTDYKNAMHYQVGQTFGNITIDTILMKAPNTYAIYVKDDEGVIFRWKTIENMPVVIEYDLKAFN